MYVYREINCESVVQNQRPGKNNWGHEGKNACNIADGKKPLANTAQFWKKWAIYGFHTYPDE